MADILRFPLEPFAWLWTAVILGLIVALPDRISKKITTQDNLGTYIVVAGGMFVLIFTGMIDFDMIRRSGPLVNVVKYILHPLTVGWTLILIGVVIALPDSMTDRFLSRDKIGRFIVAAALAAIVFGVGLVRLDQIVNYQLVLGIVIGAVGVLGFQRLVRRPQNTAASSETPSGTSTPAIIDVEIVTDDEDESLVLDLPTLPEA